MNFRQVAILQPAAPKVMDDRILHDNTVDPRPQVTL